MFCGKCGTRNPELNKFCRECGAKLPERPNRALTEDQFADLREPLPSGPVDHGKVAVLMDVAFSYHREGKIDQAVETCLQAISLNVESTSAHSLLALLYEEKGQFDEAVAHLRRVLELNPDSVADHANLARILGDTSPGMVSVLGDGPAARLLSPRARPKLAGAAAGLVVLVALSAYAIPRMRAPEGPAMASLGTPAQGGGPYAGIQQPPAPRDPAAAPGAALAAGAVSSPPVAPAFDEEPDLGPPEPPARRPAAAPRQPAQRGMPGMEPPPLPDAEEPLQPLPASRPRPVATPPVILVPSSRAQTHTPRAGAPSAPVAPRTGPTPAPEMESTISFGPESTVTVSPARPQPRAVVKVHEATPVDHQEWGLAAAAKGEYDSAVGHFQKALGGADSARERGKIHQQMAYAYQQLGRSAEAQTEYQQAISQYQEQLKQGTNADMARASIRACEQGLRTLGM